MEFGCGITSNEATKATKDCRKWSEKKSDEWTVTTNGKSRDIFIFVVPKWSNGFGKKERPQWKGWETNKNWIVIISIFSLSIWRCSFVLFTPCHCKSYSLLFWATYTEFAQFCVCVPLMLNVRAIAHCPITINFSSFTNFELCSKEWIVTFKMGIENSVCLTITRLTNINV